MRRRPLGKTDLQAPELYLGTALFGEATDEAEAGRILGAARDAGSLFIDTAPSYAKGRSEEMLGRLLQGDRSNWIIATKFAAPGDLTRQHMTTSIEESLRRLKTDFVDVVYLHRDEGKAPLAETVETIGAVIRSGKARHFGVSNYAAWRIAEIVRLCGELGVPPPCVAQPNYNIINRTAETEYLPACAYYGMGVVPYSPLARGVLTGKYESSTPPAESRAGRKDKRLLETVFRTEALAAAQAIKTRAETRGVTTAEFSIKWLLYSSRVVSVLSGARTLAQWREYVAALDRDFTADDEAFVDALVPAGHCAVPLYADPLFPVRGR